MPTQIQKYHQNESAVNKARQRFNGVYSTACIKLRMYALILDECKLKIIKFIGNKNITKQIYKLPVHDSTRREYFCICIY